MTSEPSEPERGSGESGEPEEGTPGGEGAERKDLPEETDTGDVRDDGGQDDGDEDGGDAEKESEDEDRRPISVRDLMPPPSTRPSRRSPDREKRRPPKPREDEEDEETAPADEGDDTEVEGEAEDDGPGTAESVPTPVRVAMDAPPPGDSRPPEELPSRQFELDGEEWIVRITGRTITGTRPDSGALLMHLSFFRPEEPETPARRLVTVDRPLDVLYQEDLAELFARSRPPEREGTPAAEP